MEYFKDKKITLMGLGLLGRGIGDARFLSESGADLTVTDLKTKEELASSIVAIADCPNIKFVLGEHRKEDFINADLVIKGAGVPIGNEYVEAAREAGVPVKMSTSLFAELSPATIVGITGTRGKSTVTHLIHEILRKAGRNVFCGGNVRGVSTLAHLTDSTKDEIAVLELDSWQLQGFGEADISPYVSVFTTFMSDHMNYYKNDLDMYLSDKANIFLNQTENDHLVLGAQVSDLIEKRYGELVKGTTHKINPDSIPLNINPSLLGEHNRANSAVAKEVALILDIDEDIIDNTIKEFSGVPGRLQSMGEVEGIKIYNDTTATTPDATIAALSALGNKKDIVLIMGGFDKGLSMDALLDEVEKYCKWVVLLPGTGTERIYKDIEKKDVELRDVENMEQAVKDAFALADKGDTVLLSPAFSSFGLFKNEFDRGDQFTDIVNRL